MSDDQVLSNGRLQDALRARGHRDTPIRRRASSEGLCSSSPSTMAHNSSTSGAMPSALHRLSKYSAGSNVASLRPRARNSREETRAAPHGSIEAVQGGRGRRRQAVKGKGRPVSGRARFKVVGSTVAYVHRRLLQQPAAKTRGQNRYSAERLPVTLLESCAQIGTRLLRLLRLCISLGTTRIRRRQGFPTTRTTRSVATPTPRTLRPARRMRLGWCKSAPLAKRT